MMEPTLSHYLLVSGALFSIGLLGVIVRRNLLIIYMSLELMLNAANVALVAMSRFGLALQIFKVLFPTAHEYFQGRDFEGNI